MAYAPVVGLIRKAASELVKLADRLADRPAARHTDSLESRGERHRLGMAPHIRVEPRPCPMRTRSHPASPLLLFATARPDGLPLRQDEPHQPTPPGVDPHAPRGVYGGAGSNGRSA